MAGRRMLLIGRVMALLWMVALLGGCGDKPENVILISIDTLRPDHLGCYGYSRYTSPAIDRIAAEGVLFTDVSATSPWTMPSHATLLTGLYPNRHGVKTHLNKLQKKTPTLASVLEAEGYNTMAIVSSRSLSPNYGFDHGFETFESMIGWKRDSASIGRIVNRGDEITDRGIKWLKGRDKRPFFLFLHYYDVHTDLTPKPDYRKMFVRPYKGQVKGSTSQLVAMRNKNIPLKEAGVRHLNDLYDAEIRQLDDVLAGLFQHLDESGLAESTLVIITSDHGEEFMEHGSLLHGRTYFQEVISIPLIMRGPGVPRGVTIDEPASLVDVAPTVMKHLGLPILEGNEGIDLRLLWSEERSANPPDRFLFAEADHMGEEDDMYRMVRFKNYKLCYNRLTKKSKLFDLKHDPKELNDLSERERKQFEALMKGIEEFTAGEVTGEEIGLPSEEELDRLRQLGYAR